MFLRLLTHSALNFFFLWSIFASEQLATAENFDFAKAAVRKFVLSRFPDVQVHYYEIAQDSLIGIKQEIRHRGPVDSTGTSRDALTKWKVKWRYKKDQFGNVIDVHLEHHVDLYFPKWNPKGAVTPETRKEWERYSVALAEHEAGHVERFKSRFPEIRKRINEHRDKYGSVSVKEAKKIAKGVLEEMHEADRKFDEETDNGRADGVKLKGSDDGLHPAHRKLR